MTPNPPPSSSPRTAILPSQRDVARRLFEKHGEDVFTDERNAAEMVNEVLEMVLEVVLAEGAVTLRGLGRLQVVSARSPVTVFGKPVATRPRRRMVFRASRALIQKLNSERDFQEVVGG